MRFNGLPATMFAQFASGATRGSWAHCRISLSAFPDVMLPTIRRPSKSNLPCWDWCSAWKCFGSCSLYYIRMMMPKKMVTTGMHEYTVVGSFQAARGTSGPRFETPR